MSERTFTIEHGDATYYGHVAKITSTSLGYAAHGVLSAWLNCSWSGGGVGVGGYCLDRPKNKESRDYSRVGTAYGLDHIIRIIETVGVEKWEDLAGASVIVLFDNKCPLGSRVKGIAGLHNDEVLILQEHADSWRNAAVSS